MLIYERFHDTDEFFRAITTRPQNARMQGKDTAQRDGTGWHGTKTWQEAVDQYHAGLADRAAKMTDALKRIKARCNAVTEKNRVRIRNYYHGYTPNVAAAVAGLPKSMRQRQRTPYKTPVVNVVYDVTLAGYNDPEQLEKAGETVLQLVALLEYSGYRVRLDLCIFNVGTDTMNPKNKALGIITLKDYQHRLDLLKLSFPLASASMFRRFGFRWLETVPDMDKLTARECTHFRDGYGYCLSKDTARQSLAEAGHKLDDVHFIRVDDCQQADWDADKLAAAYGITL